MPAGHGIPAAEFGGQNDPSSHARQLLALCSGCREPGGQGSHAALPVAFAVLPGEHILGGAAPPAQKNPMEHSKHSGMPLMSLTLP